MDRIKILREVQTIFDSISGRTTELKQDIEYIHNCIKSGTWMENDILLRTVNALQEICSMEENCRDLCTPLELKVPKTKKVAELKNWLDRTIQELEQKELLVKYRKFLELETKEKETKQLLKKYKKNLEELLAGYAPGKENEMEIYRQFVEAVLETDSTKLINYAVVLSPFFDMKLVGKAIIDKVIYLPGQVKGDELIAVTREEMRTVPAKKETAPTNLQNFTEKQGEEEAKQGEEDASLAGEITAKTLCLSDAGAAGEFYAAHSPRESRKFGVKEFINDVKAKYEDLNIAVLKNAYVFDSVNTELICAEAEKPLEEVVLSIEYLQKKGYLWECGTNKLGAIYVLAQNGARAFQSKESRSYLGLKGVKRTDTKKECVEGIYPTLTRIAYLNLILLHYQCLGKNCKCQNYIWEEGFYSLFNEPEGEQYHLMLGAVWSGEDKAVSCFREMEKEAKEESERDYKSVIVAGFNHEYAKKLAAFFIEKLGFSPAYLFCYGLVEQEYISFESGEKAEIEAVLKGGKTSASEQTKAERKKEGKEIEPQTKRGSVSEMEFAGAAKEAMDNAYRMISDEKIYCATTYLRSVMERIGELEPVYRKLGYAVNVPWMKCVYNSRDIFTIYSDQDDIFSQSLMVSATLRNFFMNHFSYDYDMKALYRSVKESALVRESHSLTDVLYLLMQFKEDMHKGIDFYADYRDRDRVFVEQELKKVVSEAKSYYETYVLGHIKENANHKRFIETKKRIFSQESDFVLYFKVIVDGEYKEADAVSAYLQKTFLRGESEPQDCEIDTDKLNAFVDYYWDKAAEAMREARKSSDLMSRLRNNLLNAIEKVLRVMCAWIGLVERMNSLRDDEGSRKYKEVKADILSDLKEICAEFEKRLENAPLSENAGIKVILNTIEELRTRLNGSYSERQHKYYYIDFLKGNHVLLDENYLPDMRGKFEDFEEFSLPNRILQHAKSELMTFEEKLDYIFHHYGDDYGSAKLIVNYLNDMGQTEWLENENYDIKKSEEMAVLDARQKLEDFIQTLELAQSYGQIEETKEDKKEKIQKIANDWYEYAVNTGNYGFFNMVLEQYKKKIHEDAKVRGNALLQELNRMKEKSGQTERTQRRMEKIQEMIDKQNYTVAEDLLSRIESDEPEEALLMTGVDYLQKFIDDYEYNYRRAFGTDRKLSDILSPHIKNKDDRGAKRLVDNWMSNGGTLGMSRLTALLEALGFAGVTVEEQPKIGKLENYFVRIARPENGRKVNYKHPIAAFGSRAEDEGFRVVCLVGRFDADRLIEEFKNITGLKNNLILLDHTLSLSDRRKLARKVKSDLKNTIFAVLDRVLLAFLINNYNIQFVNQILMQVMMPFAYYQPYVWDASNEMPPELFMGRKEELEKIESPEGVNIVYGGRQLGKSALLRMAKRDIDRDENHNRAVLVVLKDCDYEKAANKIGHELYDVGILDQDIDTKDWDELARTIRRRLMDQRKVKIPYLLLLLDEADAFIESCQRVNFHPFDALKDIQSVGTGRFKFVVAGLHNVVRFKRNLALSNNSVLTHLTSLTVKPFDKREARQLLEEPLYYLGFRFPEEKQSLVSLILANTNYFPGLIQLYCANLIEAMRKSDYAGYDQYDAPAYEIQDNHIKKVLSNANFKSQIREKFEITLLLEDDNLYYIIALLMAHLYHQNVNSASESEGYSARNIIDAAEGYGFKKIVELSESAVDGLLEELRELNILRQTVNRSYLFSRYSFFQMMGTAAEVDNNLMKYMED